MTRAQHGFDMSFTPLVPLRYIFYNRATSSQRYVYHSKDRCFLDIFIFICRLCLFT